MRPLFVSCCLLSALTLTSVDNTIQAQALPKEQPNLVTIVREKVKVGRAAEHAKHEAGWPAAYEKAKSPDFYVGLTSLTGSPEAWYLVPWQSYAAEGESLKREDKDPVLSAELARLMARDAEFIDSSCVIQAVARKDLSIGGFPDIAKSRFYEIGIYHVRIGQTDAFDALAKAYGAARLRAAPKSSYRVYMVSAGMPTPAYIVISSVENYAQFDQLLSDSMETFSSATDDEKAQFAKLGEIVEKEESNRFRLDPIQSYVPKDVREKDPDFWMPK